VWYDPKLHFDWESEILGGFEDESTWSIAFYFHCYFRRICNHRHRLSPTAHQISSHGKMGGRFYQNSVYPCHNYQLDFFANQLRIGKIPGLLEGIGAFLYHVSYFAKFYFLAFIFSHVSGLPCGE